MTGELSQLIDALVGRVLFPVPCASGEDGAVG